MKTKSLFSLEQEQFYLSKTETSKIDTNETTYVNIIINN